MTRPRVALFWCSAFATGALLAVVLIISVFASGQTFGQRCAIWYAADSPEWSDCIIRMGRESR